MAAQRKDGSAARAAAARAAAARAAASSARHSASTRIRQLAASPWLHTGLGVAVAALAAYLVLSVRSLCIGSVSS